MQPKSVEIPSPLTTDVPSTRNRLRDGLIHRWVLNQEWRVGDRIFRTELLTLGEAVGEKWLALCAKIVALAEELGGENVRLIVWATR